MSTDLRRTTLDYATPPDPRLRRRTPAAGFFVGWLSGFVLSFLCVCVMCGNEMWLPYAVAFPHAAVADELGFFPGRWFFVGMLGPAPLTHALYGALIAARSRPCMLAAGVLHIICLAWSLALPDPILA